MLPTRPAESAVPLSRSAWVGLSLLFALCFAHFWVRTLPVRLANTDDVAFQQLVDDEQVAFFTDQNAREQGRFYFASPVFSPVFALPYQVHTAWLYSLLRTAALFIQTGKSLK